MSWFSNRNNSGGGGSGSIGPTGPTGPIGPTGPTGLTGDIGPQGPMGDSSVLGSNYAIIDFGNSPTNTATVTISNQNAVTSTCVFNIKIAPIQTLDHNDIEHIIVANIVTLEAINIIPSTSFDVFAITTDVLLTGKFTIFYEYKEFNEV